MAVLPGGRRLRGTQAAAVPWDAIGITLGTLLCAGLCAAGVVIAYYAVRLLIGIAIGLWVLGIVIGWVNHELSR